VAQLTSAEIADQNARTTPLGLIGRAVEHYAAAVIVYDALAEGGVTWVPSGPVEPATPPSADHLLAMAIEVSLKAFLRQRNLDVVELKQKYGHDLERLIERATKEGLAASLSVSDLGLIGLLNGLFLRREFEFTVTGFRRMPRFSEARQLACKIFRAVLDEIPLSLNFLSGKAGSYLARDLS
jgi:hypothetical protein